MDIRPGETPEEWERRTRLQEQWDRRPTPGTDEEQEVERRRRFRDEEAAHERARLAASWLKVLVLSVALALKPLSAGGPKALPFLVGGVAALGAALKFLPLPARYRILVGLGGFIALTGLSYACATGPSPGSPSSGVTSTGPGRPSEAAPPPGAAVSLDRSFYIVADGSGSMTEAGCSGRFGNRLGGAQWAIQEFVTQSVPAEVNLGLYVFDSRGAGQRVGLGKGNRPQILAAVDRISGGGNTPLNASLRAGVDALVAQRDQQLGYGEFYVVVATDGEATDGDLRRDAVRYALDRGIPIVTIGFCIAGNHPLADSSISYRDAHDPEELLAALRETQGESPYYDATVFRRN